MLPSHGAMLQILAHVWFQLILGCHEGCRMTYVVCSIYPVRINCLSDFNVYYGTLHLKETRVWYWTTIALGKMQKGEEAPCYSCVTFQLQFNDIGNNLNGFLISTWRQTIFPFWPLPFHWMEKNFWNFVSTRRDERIMMQMF